MKTNTSFVFRYTFAIRYILGHVFAKRLKLSILLDLKKKKLALVFMKSKKDRTLCIMCDRINFVAINSNMYLREGHGCRRER